MIAKVLLLASVATGCVSGFVSPPRWLAVYEDRCYCAFAEDPPIHFQSQKEPSTGASQPEAMVKKLASEDVSWRTRQATERALLQASNTPAERAVALRAVFREIEAHGPWFLLHPGFGSAERDAKILPAHAQIGYALHRVWSELARGPKDPLIGKSVTELYKSAETQYGRGVALEALKIQFVADADAEAPLRRELRVRHDPKCAEILVANCPEKYADEVLDMIEQKDLSIRARVALFRAFSPPRAKGTTTAQRRRLMSIGFELVEANVADGAKDAAYQLVVDLEGHTGHRFRPSQKAEEYQTKNGLSDRHFSDSVSSALEWWRKEGSPNRR